MCITTKLHFKSKDCLNSTIFDKKWCTIILSANNGIMPHGSGAAFGETYVCFRNISIYIREPLPLGAGSLFGYFSDILPCRAQAERRFPEAAGAVVCDAVVSDLAEQYLFRHGRHRSEPVTAHNSDLRSVHPLRLPADAGHPPQAAAIFYPALLSGIRAGA